MDHLEWRQDNRDLVRYLSQRYRTVLFVRHRDFTQVRETLGQYAEVRGINEQKHSLRNRFLANLHSVGKILPKSRKNYYLMEHFKLVAIGKKGILAGRLRLRLHRLLPDRFTYDTYLDALELKRKTKIDDIDTFLFTTDILNDAMLARVLESGKPVTVYVTSWDHPCKHTTFSSRVKYLTWSDRIGADVEELQHIPADNIETAGAGALTYLHRYLQTRTPDRQPPARPYLFFGCSIGIRELVGKEIQIIKELALRLQREMPGVDLLVRPYPSLERENAYAELDSFDCIKMDSTHRLRGMHTSTEGLFEKYATIDGAMAFLHLGTTLGLEASYLNPPSIILDYGYEQTDKILSLRSFIHQYQLEKYMLTEWNNVAHSLDQLMRMLHDIQKSKFNNRDNYVIERFPLVSFETWAGKLESHLGLIPGNDRHTGNPATFLPEDKRSTVQPSGNS